MLNFTTLQTFIQLSRMILDILIMSLLLYYCLKIVRNNSRTIQIFKGILLVVVINSLAKFLGLNTVSWAATAFVNWGFIAVIIIFQPEIRSLLEKLGKTSVFSRLSTLSGNEKEKLVDELVKATMLLSSEQTGALITIEQSHSLSDYIKTGTPMNSMVTAELLTSIFVTSTPLHDGAVIIQGDKLACASAYFPPTNMDLPSRYGARHRAAIGISEITDSITIVVSEETGNVSIAQEGKLIPMTKTKLQEFLMKIICNEEIELRGKKIIKKEAVNERILEIEKEIKEEKIVQQQTASEVNTVKDKPVEPIKEKSGLLNLFKKKDGEDKSSSSKEIKNKSKKAVIEEKQIDQDIEIPLVEEPVTKTKRVIKKRESEEDAITMDSIVQEIKVVKKKTPKVKKIVKEVEEDKGVDKQEPIQKEVTPKTSIDLDRDFKLEFSMADDVEMDSILTEEQPKKEGGEQ